MFKSPSARCRRIRLAAYMTISTDFTLDFCINFVNLFRTVVP
jgi:hypothetical protein